MASRTSPTRSLRMAQAAVGSELKFNVRIELGGDAAPDPAVVEEINALLSEVSDDLKFT